MSHAPVLLEAVVAVLAPAAGETHVDCTFGGGSYTRALLEAGAWRVIGVDRDAQAVARARVLEEEFGARFAMRAGVFGDLAEIVDEPIDGAVFDFGVSSFQLDTPERGFSFRFDAPLDMRMGQSGPHAGDAVNELSETALAEALFFYGEEPGSRRIARAITATRRAGQIRTTAQLAELVEKALGGRRGQRTHPATRTFQALRMLVNDELGQIAAGLAGAEQRLKPGGRLVCVAFHSLEDRVVKAFLETRTRTAAPVSRYAPSQAIAVAPSFQRLSRKVKTPDDDETSANRRARSAKLRAALRTSAPAFTAQDWIDPAPLARQEWERLT